MFLTTEGAWTKASPACGEWLIACQGTTPFEGMSLRHFTRALEQCGIADTRVAGLAGSFCLTPVGCQIFDFFAQTVHRVYRQFGFAEWSYPSLTTETALAGYISALDLQHQLVYASGNARSGIFPWVLCPTGEAIVYPHWKSTIRTADDLPLRIYRVASYFRAPHGKHTEGIFRQTESSGIFECFAAHATPEQAANEFESLQEMLKEALKACHLYDICSKRPLITNNRKVSHQTIGFDVPLPTGKTIQAASIYLQGDRLARIFGITYSDRGTVRHTSHVAGYISRRTALIQLLLGLCSDGTFILHPAWQPTQVLILYKAHHAVTDTVHLELSKFLVSRGLRAVAHVATDNRQLRRLRKQYRQQGTGVDVVILPKRTPEDTPKVILTRYDLGKEISFLFQGIEQLGIIIADTIRECEKHYLVTQRHFFNARLVPCCSLAEVRKTLCSGHVALGRLQAGETIIERLESELRGEILGFAKVAPREPCLVSGRQVFTVAYFSRRM